MIGKAIASLLAVGTITLSVSTLDNLSMTKLSKESSRTENIISVYENNEATLLEKYNSLNEDAKRIINEYKNIIDTKDSEITALQAQIESLTQSLLEQKNNVSTEPSIETPTVDTTETSEPINTNENIDSSQNIDTSEKIETSENISTSENVDSVKTKDLGAE